MSNPRLQRPAGVGGAIVGDPVELSGGAAAAEPPSRWADLKMVSTTRHTNWDSETVCLGCGSPA